MSQCPIAPTAVQPPQPAAAALSQPLLPQPCTAAAAAATAAVDGGHYCPADEVDFRGAAMLPPPPPLPVHPTSAAAAATAEDMRLARCQPLLGSWQQLLLLPSQLLQPLSPPPSVKTSSSCETHYDPSGPAHTPTPTPHWHLNLSPAFLDKGCH